MAGAGGVLVTCGGDGVVNALRLGDAAAAAAAAQPLALAAVCARRPPPPAGAAAAAVPTARLHAAVYGDEAPLPIRACALDEGSGAETAFVATIGGMLYALPLAAGGDGEPYPAASPCTPLPAPAPSALQCLAVLTLPLGRASAVTLLLGGASDGSVYVWQWCRDSASFSQGPVAVLGAPLGAPASAAPPGAPPPPPAPITACAPTLLPAGSSSQASALVALGDAAGVVGLRVLLVRRGSSSSSTAAVACTLDAARSGGGGGAPPGAAAPASATVEFQREGAAASAAVACEALAQGDIFTGGASGVTGAVWAPGFGSGSGGGSALPQCRLVTSGSDGRVTLWSADGAGGAAGLQPLAVLATGAVVRCLRLSPLGGGGGGGGGAPAQLLTCGNTGGEVRVWSLGKLWERARGGGARAALGVGARSAQQAPALLTASDALVCALPLAALHPAAQAQQPLTALAVRLQRGGGVCVAAGSRAGGLAVWYGSPPAV